MPSPAPRLGAGPLGIGLRSLAAIAILVVANLAVVPFTAVLSAVPGLRELGSELSWATLGIYACLGSVMWGTAVLLAWLWVRFVERRRLADIGLRFTPSSALWLLLATLAAMGVVLGTAAVLPSTGPAPSPEQVAEQGPFLMVLLMMLIPAFLVQGFPEELLFRGMLLSAMRSRPVLAVAVATLSFTIIHLVSNGWQQTLGDRFLFLVMPFGFSLFATALLVWTRSLWAAVGVHGGMHLGTNFSQLLPPTDPALSWTVAGVVFAVLGVAILAVLLKRGRGIPDGAERWR